MPLSEAERAELDQLQNEKKLFIGGQTVKGIDPIIQKGGTRARSMAPASTPGRRIPWQEKLASEYQQDKEEEATWSKKFDQSTYELGGKAAEMSTKMGLPPEVGGAVGAATQTGARILPDLIAGGVGGIGGAAAKVPLNAIAKSSMATALKVPEFIGPTVRKTDQIVQTMLDEGISVTKGGIEKLRGKIDEIQKHVDDIILNSSANVNIVRAGSELRGVLTKFQKNTLDGRSNTEAIKQAWDDIRNNPLLKGKTEIPIQLAQEMKKESYRDLRAMGAYERQNQPPIRMAAKEAVAGGWRKEIANAEPAIADWNAEEGKLLAALAPTERRVLQEMRNDKVGLSLLAHNTAAMAGFVANRSAAFRSLAARMIYSKPGSKTGGRIGAGTGVSLFELGKAYDDQEE